MNELFRFAAESMLKIYGTDAKLKRRNGTLQAIRVSPLFNAKLRREDSGSGTLTSDANIIVSGCTDAPLPGNDVVVRNGQEWNILSANGICPRIFELELKR